MDLELTDAQKRVYTLLRFYMAEDIENGETVITHTNEQGTRNINLEFSLKWLEERRRNAGSIWEKNRKIRLNDLREYYIERLVKDMDEYNYY